MAVVEATRTEVERLNVLDSAEGQIALALAAALDSQTSLMAAPAMAKELRATLDTLRDRAPKAADSVDEFTRKRDERRNSRTA